MNSIKEDKFTPRKLTRYHLTMTFLAVVIVAVGAATIFSTSASSAKKSTKPKTSFTLAADNTNQNPVIKLDCEKPRLTVAVMIDRSGSVSADDSNEGNYKNSVNKFIEDLSDVLIDRGGDLDVLLWGFGSRSIQQNDKTSSNVLITKVDSSTSLADMKDTVNKIFFSKSANGANDLSMNGNTTAYAKARGYNAGFPTTGNYTMTNWDDALIQVKNIGSTSDYNDPTPGNHINLALMLTDGEPNVNNGTDRIFTTGDLGWFDSAAGRQYSSNTVTDLRTGNGLPPMMVRGVLINSESTSAMNQVFGPGNWSKAEDFDDDLKKVLDEIVDLIDSNVECQYVFVKPRIEVTAPSSLNIVEGPSGKTIQVTVKNVSTMTDRKGNPIPCNEIGETRCDLKNASFTYNGITYVLGELAFSASEQGPLTITIELGETIPGNQIMIEGQASFTPSSAVRLDRSLCSTEKCEEIYVAKDTTPISINIERLPLPA